MALSDTLRKYLNSQSAQQLLQNDDVTEFLTSSFTLISDSDYKELVNLLMLKYDDIFGEIDTLVAGMFQNCNTIADVALDSAIRVIPSQCFENSNIKKLRAAGTRTISARAFCNCKQLKEISIPNVEVIGSGAFKGCESLTNVTLSTSIGKIGMRAFDGCTSLHEIKYEGTKEEARQIKWGIMWDGSHDNSNIKIICTDGEL